MSKQIQGESQTSGVPRSVDEAAEKLLSDFLVQHLRDLADLTDSDFERLCGKLAPYLNAEFKIWQGNDALIESCERHYRHEKDDPARIILNRVKDMLRDFHGLFIIL